MLCVFARGAVNNVTVPFEAWEAMTEHSMFDRLAA